VGSYEQGLQLKRDREMSVSLLVGNEQRIQPTIQLFTKFDDEKMWDESGSHVIAFQRDTSSQFVSSILKDPSNGAPTQKCTHLKSEVGTQLKSAA
jgi:hypothetical protein